MNARTPKPPVPHETWARVWRPGGAAMAPDALRMLARQLRRDPNPDAIEDAACALEAVTIGQERQARGPGAGYRDDAAP